jgi:hypothetical protein
LNQLAPRPYTPTKAMTTRTLPPFVPIAGVSWGSRPLIGSRVSLRSVTTRFGPPSAVDQDSNGLGDFDLWCVAFPCGLEITLWLLQLDPNGTGAPITDDITPRGIDVYANDGDLEHILFHLALELPDVSPSSLDKQGLAPHVWRLLRQDDNGHVFEVERYSSSCEAKAVQDGLEAHTHKQLYWIEGPAKSPES